MITPAFDPSVYETLELGEINRPHHAAFWTFKVVEDAYRAKGSTTTDAEYFAARAVYEAARDECDRLTAEYIERAEAAAQVEPLPVDDGQLSLI